LRCVKTMLAPLFPTLRDCGTFLYNSNLLDTAIL
jgi:hypothetical protein